MSTDPRLVQALAHLARHYSARIRKLLRDIALGLRDDGWQWSGEFGDTPVKQEQSNRAASEDWVYLMRGSDIARVTIRTLVFEMGPTIRTNFALRVEVNAQEIYAALSGDFCLSSSWPAYEDDAAVEEHFRAVGSADAAMVLRMQAPGSTSTAVHRYAGTAPLGFDSAEQRDRYVRFLHDPHARIGSEHEAAGDPGQVPARRTT